MRLAVRITRQAISPRLAIRIFANIRTVTSGRRRSGPARRRSVGSARSVRRRSTAPAPAVIAGPKAAADNHGEFRHRGAGDRGHHLGAVLGNALVLVFAAHHEAGDVLQKYEGNAALGAELDEMRALQGALGKQDAVIGEDADRIAPDPGEAADQGRAVELLELVQFAAVDDAGDDLAHLVRPTDVAGDDT